eukprot:4727438-Pyramimonas_sp.AAC.1
MDIRRACMLEAVGAGKEEHEGRRVSFEQAVQTANLRRGLVPRADQIYSRTTHTYLRGDVVFCKAGELPDGTLSSEGFWPAVVVEPVSRDRQGPRCFITVLWLEPIASTTPGQLSFHLDPASATTQIKTILRDEQGRPLFIPV